MYRLRFFPSSPHDHITAAWLLAGPEIAVVSHESALELYDLSNVIAAEVHLTLPRAYRHRRPPPGVRLHRPREPLRQSENRRVRGLPTTTVERTLLDVLERGTTQPEQIELALGQALERGLTTPRRLAGAASCRPTTVRTKLDRLVAMA